MILFAAVVAVGLLVACWRATHRRPVRLPVSEPPSGVTVLRCSTFHEQAIYVEAWPPMPAAYGDAERAT